MAIVVIGALLTAKELMPSSTNKMHTEKLNGLEQVILCILKFINDQ